MLKVLKYDWKNGWNAVKVTLPAALILSVVVGLLLGAMGAETQINGNMVAITGEDAMNTSIGILFIVWFGVMVALLVQTIDTIIKNMSTRMFGPEGNLTHTLPVQTWELLAGKALGTWLFGVFMVLVAFASVSLLLLTTAAGTGGLMKMLTFLVDALPKLGSYHLQQIAKGAGYVLLGTGAFLAWSLLIVVHFQFICIASRQFGKYHIAGAVIVLWVLLSLEGNINRVLSAGFLVCLLVSAACFLGSHWLLEHRLSIG